MGGYWLLYGLLAVALVGAILPLWRLGRRRSSGDPLIPIRRATDDMEDYPGRHSDE
jgi:hypothetical protein